MDTAYSKHPRVRSGENDRIAQEYDREDGKSKSSKEIGKETKWSDRSPTARNDGGNEFTKQRQDTGEIKHTYQSYIQRFIRYVTIITYTNLLLLPFKHF